jgi:hypothetical protein
LLSFWSTQFHNLNFKTWRIPMRQSASRIRSLSIRYALAEAAAFPGICTERVSFPFNRKPAAEYKHSRLRPAHQV